MAYRAMVRRRESIDSLLTVRDGGTDHRPVPEAAILLPTQPVESLTECQQGRAIQTGSCLCCQMEAMGRNIFSRYTLTHIPVEKNHRRCNGMNGDTRP